jgi:hypothetical protein
MTWNSFDLEKKSTWPACHLRFIAKVKSDKLAEGFTMYAIRARCGVFVPLLYPDKAIKPADILAWKYAPVENERFIYDDERRAFTKRRRVR